MYSAMKARTGDEAALAAAFLRERMGQMRLEIAALDHPEQLVEENILAVHFADGGAQGDAGAVRILYRSPQGVQVLYGNYVYGTLNLDAVIKKLPMLSSLDSRYRLEPPYPFGGKLSIPEGWGYMYMGAMNHFFARDPICDQVIPFIQVLFANGGQNWLVFDAVAWFCGVDFVA